MWRLLGIQGPYTGRSFDLSQSRVSVGSGPSCDIDLGEDESVAERQAEFTVSSGECGYRDTDSRCPTMVNGIDIKGTALLRHGDIVQIGETVFRLEGSGTDSRHGAPAGSIGQPPVPPTAQAGSGPGRKKRQIWTAVTMALLAAILLGTMAARQLSASRHRREVAIATEKVLVAMKNVQSALKVGVDYDLYSSRIADTQGMLDRYTEKYGTSAISRKLSSVQQCYADIGRLWQYEITEQGFVTQEGSEQLYGSCIERYGTALEEGCALSGSRISPHAAQQIILQIADRRLQAIRVPR